LDEIAVAIFASEILNYLGIEGAQAVIATWIVFAEVT
jgi:hypothetical protein